MPEANAMAESFEVGPEDAPGRKPSSFLNPVGQTAKEVPPKAIGARMELIVFFFFVFVRALHPIIISNSKVENETTGKKEFPHNKTSPVVAMTVSLCILNLIFCWAVGGKKQFMSIFAKEPFLIFSINGAIYALGDYLEMAGLEGISAAAYTILQQFRIVLTAILLIPVKNQYQTRLQWTILCILMFAMSTYMCISEGGGNKVVNGSAIKGYLMSIAKVFVSCMGAVITDKYMKKYATDPTHVCIARTFVARAIFIVLLSFTQKDAHGFIWSDGFVSFFRGWNWMSVAVTCSFIVKSVSTIYIVALLDSILKNIAEALSVLFVYAYEILAGKSFDPATFMAVLVVVAACGAYIDSKSVVDKASKFDAIQAASK